MPKAGLLRSIAVCLEVFLDTAMPSQLKPKWTLTALPISHRVSLNVINDVVDILQNTNHSNHKSYWYCVDVLTQLFRMDIHSRLKHVTSPYKWRHQPLWPVYPSSCTMDVVTMVTKPFVVPNVHSYVGKAYIEFVSTVFYCAVEYQYFDMYFSSMLTGNIGIVLFVELKHSKTLNWLFPFSST